MVSKLYQVLIFLGWIALDAEGPMTDSLCQYKVHLASG